MRALRSRNYRLFFSGQSVSLIGTWMTRVATGWLVYRLTGSAVLLGTVSFAGQVPAFFLAPLAGVLFLPLGSASNAGSDANPFHVAVVCSRRLGPRRCYHGLAEIALLALAQGFINAFDMPASTVFRCGNGGGPKDLGNAIALNSSMINAARLVGPALAGIVIAAVGEAYCFLVDGISYLAVIASF